MKQSKTKRPSTRTNAGGSTSAKTAATQATEGDCVQAQSRSTEEQEGIGMDDSIPRAIVGLKNELMHVYKGHSFLREVIPLSRSKFLPIDDDMLKPLHRFASANPIYFRSSDLEILSIACRIYEGDINNYWLGSKKHDTSYQPFYPTWMLSAYALALGARSLGFEELVDVGSGDGRIAYCGRLLGNSVIGQVMSLAEVKRRTGFNFMGSHVMKPLSRDQTGWGWGNVISSFGLELAGTVTLPTLWTADQVVDTAYVYTLCK